MRFMVPRIRCGRGRGSDRSFRCCRLWCNQRWHRFCGGCRRGRWLGGQRCGWLLRGCRAVATAAGALVWVGVAPADAVVSLLDGVGLVCAPPELCTTFERGSAVGASLGAEVELAWPSTELCAIPDVERDEEPAAEAVEDVLAADSDDELEPDDDEPDDDELEELELVGSANATPGVFATAAPTPSATANAPARTMYCAFTGPARRGQPAEPPPEPACLARWGAAPVKVILATFLADAVGLRCRRLIALPPDR